MRVEIYSQVVPKVDDRAIGRKVQNRDIFPSMTMMVVHVSLPLLFFFTITCSPTFMWFSIIPPCVPSSFLTFRLFPSPFLIFIGSYHYIYDYHHHLWSSLMTGLLFSWRFAVNSLIIIMTMPRTLVVCIFHTPSHIFSCFFLLAESCLPIFFLFWHSFVFCICLTNIIRCTRCSGLHNIPPPVQNTVPQPINQPALCRGRPERTPGLIGKNTSYIVPDNIRKKFSDGWNTHVTLSYLTYKSCQFKTKSALSAAQSILSFNPSTGQVIATLKVLHDNGELELTFDEWNQAWRRLLYPLVNFCCGRSTTLTF